MSYTFDTTSFLLFLGQPHQYYIIDSCFFSRLNFYVAKDEKAMENRCREAMMELCEIEIENLLLDDVLDLSERKKMKLFHRIRSDEIKASNRPKFETTFCNQHNILPTCLVGALSKNKEFVRFANGMARYVAKSLVENIQHNITVHEEIGHQDELEALIRSFPLILGSFFEYASRREWFQYLPLIARLRLEYGWNNNCDEKKKIVKLVKEGFHWPTKLDICPCDICPCEYCDTRSQNDSRRYFEEVMNELRTMDLVRKEDFREFRFDDCKVRCTKCTDYLCDGSMSWSLPKFRYLVNWDPTLLKRGDRYSDLPLQIVIDGDDSIATFVAVLELGVKYFPNKLGFLYHMNMKKNWSEATPFERACDDYGEEEVAKIVNNVLFPKIDAMESPESILVSLAMDDAVHMEVIYTLLQRNPSVLARVNRKRKRIQTIKNTKTIV